MDLLIISRKVHKWLMLFLGLQFMVWSISGAYMVIVNIDYIHGDTLVVNHQTKIDGSNINYPLSALVKQYPNAKNIEIGMLIHQVVYRFSDKNQKRVVNASNAKLLSPITEENAKKVALHYYSGTSKISQGKLIVSNPPSELSSRVLPAWRFNFNDGLNTSIYISEKTGKLVGKRHEFWRIFDVLFNFHVMDYRKGDPSNKLLLIVGCFSFLATISGIILSYLVLFFKRKSHLLKVLKED